MRSPLALIAVAGTALLLTSCDHLRTPGSIHQRSYGGTNRLPAIVTTPRSVSTKRDRSVLYVPSTTRPYSGPVVTGRGYAKPGYGAHYPARGSHYSNGTRYPHGGYDPRKTQYPVHPTQNRVYRPSAVPSTGVRPPAVAPKPTPRGVARPPAGTSGLGSGPALRPPVRSTSSRPSSRVRDAVSGLTTSIRGSSRTGLFSLVLQSMIKLPMQ